MKHKNRANYQAEIYKHFMSQNPEIPSPVGNGWKKITSENKEETLAIDWMDLNPAPNSTLEPMNRSCQIIKCAKKKKRCTFYSNKLLCTDLCKCHDCEDKTIEHDLKTYDQEGYELDNEELLELQ